MTARAAMHCAVLVVGMSGERFFGTLNRFRVIYNTVRPHPMLGDPPLG